MIDLYKEICRSDFFLIAGPCVIEEMELLEEIAQNLCEETQKRNILLIFKSSYEKANRTSATSYIGPGKHDGLEMLFKIKEKFQVPILTDIHNEYDAADVAEVADILQIPAFLSRQTSLLEAAGKTGKVVNIKKGQFMAPEDIFEAALKVKNADNNKILLTERGTSFGYHNLVVDFRSFAIMEAMGFPVIYDVTHSLQQPSIGKISGGTPQYAAMMAKAAVATGKVKGLFIETHPEPLKAQSDARSMLPLAELPSLLDKVLRILGR
ncbi:MAG: 3-deoxy-8-phosphooctulonate synthase [Candidatus Cloacimonetes bacterium]|nr:3-deoxy-8-phosphooctulonate synthase [Candidatus Cloacimonadota bacterium]